MSTHYQNFSKVLTSIGDVLRVSDVDHPQSPSAALNHGAENAVGAVVVHAEDDEVGEPPDAARQVEVVQKLLGKNGI